MSDDDVRTQLRDVVAMVACLSLTVNQLVGIVEDLALGDECDGIDDECSEWESFLDDHPELHG
jgi:hypothetical protein